MPQPVDYLHVRRMQLPAEPAEWPAPVDRPAAHWRGYYLGILDGSEPQLPAEVGRAWGHEQGGAYGSRATCETTADSTGEGACWCQILIAEMTTLPPIDPTVPDEFLTIASDLDTIADAARDVLDGGPDWTNESEAAAEVKQEPQFRDEWATAPVSADALIAYRRASARVNPRLCRSSPRRHGFRVTAPRWKPGNNVRALYWYIDRPPTDNKLVGDLLASSGQVGITLNRYTSAFVHAQPRAFSFMITGEGIPVRPGIAYTSLSTGLDRVLLYTMGAALALDAAVARAAELFGKATDDWQSAFGPIMLRWAQWSKQMRSTDEIPIGEVGRLLGLWLPTMRRGT